MTCLSLRPVANGQRAQLAAWGVPWPPPRGWKDELTERWKVAPQDGAPPPPRRPVTADFAEDAFDVG
ncbi:hypothetical protein GCM10010304_81470 [Streptomyces roseoviolaceus]